MVQTRTSTWFEVRTRVERTAEDGANVSVAEVIVVEATSWTEAEARTAAEYDGETFETTDIRKTPYSEIIFDSKAKTKFYKCKVAFTHLDGRSGKEKKTFSHFLVEAADIDGAKACIDEATRGTMADDCEVVSVVGTKILRVLEHAPAARMM